MQAKRSYDRDKLTMARLLPFFGDKLLKEITPAMVEGYRQGRLADPSGRTPQYLTKPATVNRELACFKTIFNKAIAIGKAEKNPAAGIEDFTFHDLRHTAINNWRLAGHDFFHIMAVSGHKTMTVFKRYNTVGREELKALVGEKI